MNTLFLSSLLSFVVWCAPIVLAMLLLALYRDHSKGVHGLRTIYAAFMFTFVANSIKFFQYLIERTYTPFYDISAGILLIAGVGFALYMVTNTILEAKLWMRHKWLPWLWIAALAGVASSYIIAPFSAGAMIGTALYVVAGLGMVSLYLVMMDIVREHGDPELPNFTPAFYSAALLTLIDPFLRFLAFSREMEMHQMMLLRTVSFAVGTLAVLILVWIIVQIARHLTWSTIVQRINLITFFDERITRRVMGIIMMTSLALTTLFVFFLYMSHNQVERVIQQHVTEDMQVVSRISAHSMQDMMSALMVDVKTMARKFGQQEKSRENFRPEFDHLYDEYQEDVLFVSHVGPHGRLQYTYPEVPSSLGKDLTYQDYMQDFLADPCPGISKPFTTVEGPIAISIYAPIWSPDSVFDGMIAVLIDVNVLEKRLSESSVSNMAGYFRVIGEDGIIIGSSLPGEAGRSLWELRREYNPDDWDAESLNARQDSMIFSNNQSSYVSQYTSALPDSDGSMHQKIAIFYRFDLNDTSWTLMYVMLHESVRQKVRQATAHQWYIWGFMLLILAVTSAVLILISIKWGRDLNEKIEQTTAELQRTERRYRLLIEQSNDAIYILRGGQFIYINKKFEELMGYSLEDLNAADFHWDQLYAPEARAYIKERLARIDRGESVPGRYEFTGLTKSGKRVFLEVNVSYIETDEGVLTQGILRDISERKEAERALRESEETYRGLINSFDDAIYIQDKDGTFLDVSEGATRMYGYSKEEMIGRTPKMLAAPGRNDMEFTFNAIKRAYNGESQLFEWWGQRKNGEAFPKEILLNKGTHFGKDVVVAIGRDVSERKELQQQLFQAQKMESIGTLAGGIAHDFNNLLTGILGYTSLLKSGIDGDENLRRYVEVIEDSGKRAAALTDQLLAFGRGGKYNVEPTRANQIVRDVINLLEHTIDKSIVISSELSDEDPVFEVEASQIHQAIMNLCLNARDAMPEGGELQITTAISAFPDIPRPVRAELERRRYVRIAITDTGHGMDEETKQKIFEPFFTTKDKGRGTGLGLAMVYGIITNHRGGIHIESELGEGATFDLYIPLSSREPDSRESESADGKTEYQWKGTALIIDDEEVSRDLIGERLKSVGFHTVSAENGQEGVEQFRKYQEDVRLVVLDMIMPVMSGRETFEEIKSIDDDAKIIIASGYSQHDQAREILKQPFTRFIQKPFEPGKLYHTIHELLYDESS